MMKPCIICYRLSSNFSNERHDPTAQETMRKFFNLMGRHLHHEPRQDAHEKGLLQPLLKDLINSGLQPCADCSLLIESFCELYHELKSIELLLNWKVLTIKNVMMDAQKCKSRLDDLRVSSTQLMNGVDIIQCKSQLAQICEQNLRASFPQVVLKRCEFKNENPPKKNAKSNLREPSLNSESPGTDMKFNDVGRTKTNVNCTFIVGNIKMGNDLQQSKNILSTSTIGAIEDNALPTPTKIQVKRESKPRRVKFDMNQSIKIESNNPPMLEEDMEQNCDWTDCESPPAHRYIKRERTLFSGDKLNNNPKAGESLGRVPDEVSSSHPQSQINLETGKIECGICKRGFLTETGFLYHWNSIHLGVRYNCPHPHCKTSFIQPSGLKFHLKTTHNSRRMSFKCPTCPKVFASKQYLDIHQASVHSGTRNRNNQCKFCSKYFSTPITMRVHMRSYCPVVLKVETDYQGLPRQKRKFNVKPKSQSGINPERQPSKFSTEAVVMDYSIYASTR